MKTIFLLCLCFCLQLEASYIPTPIGGTANANVMVGANQTPDAPLTVSKNAATLPAALAGTTLHTGQVDGTANFVDFDAFANATSVIFKRADGTNASPTAIQSGELIGQLTVLGYGATGYSASGRAFVQINAAQNWSDTAQGTKIILAVTANGTLTPQNQAFILDNDGQVYMSLIQSSTAADTGALCWNNSAGRVTENPSSSCTVSSIRFKHDVHDLTSGLSLIKRLHPVSYVYNGSERIRFGLIAEEVNRVSPTLVEKDSDGLSYSIRQMDLIGVLVRAVQQLDLENKQLNERVRELEHQ